MKKNKIFLAIAFLFAITSCKKEFLDTASTGSADDATIFATTTNAANVINGSYRYFASRFQNQNQPGHGGMMLTLDFMGEDIHQSASNWYTSSGNGTANYVTNRNAASVWVTYPFRLYYRVIGNSNALLDNIDNSTGSDANKNRLKAEALSFRAFGYLNLVQLFAKRYVPGTNNTQLGVSMPLSASDVKLPRSTVEEVYTQIHKDLDEAIALFATGSNLPVNVSASAANVKSHLSLNAAKAIKARAALVQGNYVMAADFAKQVIEAGTFSLMSNTQYSSGFNDLSNPEWIWGFFMADDQGDAFGAFHAQISWNGNTTYIRSQPKRINSALYNQIASTDIRKTMWEPAPNATNFPLPLSTYVREPYMSRKFKTRSAPTIGDVPYIRLAEMYLILAEAYARTAGREGDARQALFTLAKNRDPQYILSANSSPALIDEILIQRRIELWGEGFRFFDLKRLNLPLDRSVVPNYVSSSVGGTMQVPAGDDRFVFVLPQFELQGNPNAVQN
ncbi:MAG: RagB/SusD family nutrient uptake outer membrane protein [Flavisolibacter sp.]|nr:RagB/SusD family nutrient uptake outer membrane protein [Flavisolibacter sp.]